MTVDNNSSSVLPIRFVKTLDIGIQKLQINEKPQTQSLVKMFKQIYHQNLMQLFQVVKNELIFNLSNVKQGGVKNIFCPKLLRLGSEIMSMSVKIGLKVVLSGCVQKWPYYLLPVVVQSLLFKHLPYNLKCTTIKDGTPSKVAGYPSVISKKTYFHVFTPKQAICERQKLLVLQIPYSVL